jgi:hypothetical protein
MMINKKCLLPLEIDVFAFLMLALTSSGAFFFLIPVTFLNCLIVPALSLGCGVGLRFLTYYVLVVIGMLTAATFPFAILNCAE